MKKLFYILFFLCSYSYGQQFIVFNKSQRDSLLKELQSHKGYMDSKHIAIQPVYVMKDVYILQPELFDKSEWAAVKPTYDSKVKSTIVIRELTKEELDSIIVRDAIEPKVVKVKIK